MKHCSSQRKELSQRCRETLGFAQAALWSLGDWPLLQKSIFISLRQGSQLWCFHDTKGKNKQSLTPLPAHNAQGGISMEIKTPLQLWFYMMVVPQASPSAGCLPLQPPDPALQGTMRPVLTQTLLSGQEQVPTAIHPWCQGKVPFPTSLTVVFHHTNDSCHLVCLYAVRGDQEAAQRPSLGAWGRTPQGQGLHQGRYFNSQFQLATEIKQLSKSNSF